MKKTILSFILLYLSFITINATGSLSGNATEEGVYAIGNGQLCIYGNQVNIEQLFGPPYSSPVLLNMYLNNPKIQVTSIRKPHTNIWTHTLTAKGKISGKIVDCMSFDQPIYMREINATDTFSFRIRNLPDARSENSFTVRNSNDGYTAGTMTELYFYPIYQTPLSHNFQIITEGNLSWVPDNESGKEGIIKVNKGKGRLIIVSGKNPEKLNKLAETAKKSSIKKLQKESEASWNQYVRNQTILPSHCLNSEETKNLNQIIDDISILIKSQQSDCGGILAGHAYHLAYVRDQYGASRALLALGHQDDARKILDFYFKIWQKYGYIKNAQPMGFTGTFHCHENDHSEITAYLIIQAFDYYYKSKDNTFLRKIFPMLEWALNVQEGELADGMMPFNGDETYIAGGILPRKVMCDGSAEATLLFIESGERLLKYIKDQNLWNTEKIAHWNQLISNTKADYRMNFMENGILYINNPRRSAIVPFAESRPGVCMHPQHGGYYTQVFHFKGPLYFCADCMKKENGSIAVPEPERFRIISSSLLPFYIHSDLFTPEEKNDLLNAVIEKYKTTGKISDTQNDKILGYDFGLFLYALTESGHPLANEVFRILMQLRDNKGAWVEYYQDGKPQGCRCRPWESGINIEAAINYARSLCKE